MAFAQCVICASSSGPKGRPEKCFTKRDIFILLDCDYPEYTDTAQMIGGFHLWKKTEFSMRFAREWLDYVLDERISNDGPNRLGLPNYAGVKYPSYDQSVFSLLHKKYRMTPHKSPFAYPNEKLAEAFPDDRYPQLVRLTNRWVNTRRLILQGLWPACTAWLSSPRDLFGRRGYRVLSRGLPRLIRRLIRKRSRGQG